MLCKCSGKYIDIYFILKITFHSKSEMNFWNELARCVYDLDTRNYVVVLGDLIARVGDGDVEGVVGK